MSNPNDIFANSPRYEQTKATDVSAIIAGITQAYTKQKEAFKDISKVNDDFWKNAQTAHQQGWLDKINAMHADDFNNPKTKEQVIQELTRAGREIGGYNNITSMNGVFDTAKTNAIANANTQNEYNKNVIDNFVEGLDSTAFNYSGIVPKKERDEAIANIVKYGQELNEQGNSFNQSYFNKKVTDAEAKAVTEQTDSINNTKALTKVLFERDFAPKLNTPISLWGNALAMKRTAEASGNTAQVGTANGIINSIAGMFAVKGEKDANGNAYAKDGEITKWLSTQDPNVVKYFNSVKDSLLNESYRKSLQDYTSLNNSSLAFKMYELKEANDAVHNWAIQEGLKIEQQRADTGTATAMSNIENKNAGQVSFSGSAVIEEAYKNIGFTSPVVKNVNGEYILDVDTINTFINNKLRHISEGDLTAMEEFVANDPFINDRWSFAHSTRRDAMLAKLDDYRLPDSALEGRETDALTAYEKMAILHRAAKLKYENSQVSSEFIINTIRQIKEAEQSKGRELVNQITALLTQDTGLKEGDIITQLGWHRGSMAKYLTKASSEAANIAAKAQEGVGTLSNKQASYVPLTSIGGILNAIKINNNGSSDSAGGSLNIKPPVKRIPVKGRDWKGVGFNPDGRPTNIPR